MKMSFLEPENFAVLKASWITLEDGRHVLIVDKAVKFPSYGQARDWVKNQQQKGWRVVDSKATSEGREWVVEDVEKGRHVRVLSPHPLKK